MTIATLSQRILAGMTDLRRPRIVVIAMQKEIAKALADGLTLSEVWSQLHTEGLFPAGYDRFRRLVRQFVPHAPSKSARKRPARAVKTQPETPGFVFNPMSDPKELF
jgi:Family of unknown function (DUF5338)